MPQVTPFRGIGYALDRYGSDVVPDRVRLPDEVAAHPGRVADLTDLACPPYDVIGPEQNSALLARDERNAVRLELSAEGDPHAAARQALDAWLADGTLERREEPAAYSYAHATATDPDDLAVHGVAARVLLEAWGAGIRPHEHTMPGPKADRLALLRATGTQLSPILALYFDRSERYRQVLSRSGTDVWRARDDDGLLHQLVAIEPDDRLLDYLGGQRLLIADGHHRYETALAHQAEVRADPRVTGAAPGELAADWIMMVLVNAELEELQIWPTHRLILDGDPEALRVLAREPGPVFASSRMPSAQLTAALDAHRAGAEPVFGLVLPHDEGRLLVGDADAVATRMRQEPVSSAVRQLDLAVLHAAVLQDRLGIGTDALAAGRRVAYTRSSNEALSRVANGEAQAALLVRPTRLEQLAAVATAGDVMPQKSTYFYPKLLTGLVFNSVED
ncbi:MAG: DUF1015 family protein [Candidatus Limnocylindria bacterium]